MGNVLNDSINYNKIHIFKALKNRIVTISYHAPKESFEMSLKSLA